VKVLCVMHAERHRSAVPWCRETPKEGTITFLVTGLMSSQNGWRWGPIAAENGGHSRLRLICDMSAQISGTRMLSDVREAIVDAVPLKAMEL
jgi:hypothetical protein